MAAGNPQHPYTEHAADTVCATCALPITYGVPLPQIETPTTADHASYFRFGSQHVCTACAWLYAAGKGRPGNYIAYGNCHEYAVISLESVVEDKRPWLEILTDIQHLPPDTRIAGVMTTDVKPRLWPRTRLATRSHFGLYVHAMEYDVSEWREFSLDACLDLMQMMIEPLTSGYAKASLYYGLLRDYARTAKDPAKASAWESQLQPQRHEPHFLPALIAAGVTKEQKKDVRSVARSYPDPKQSPAVRDPVGQTQLGLL